MENEIEKSDLMQSRRITLGDGRYMIFYTFDRSLSAESSGETESEPQTKPTEEKNV